MYGHVLIFLFAGIVSTFVSNAHAAHGISIDGDVKYPPTFTRFDYASNKAEKGGHLILHDIGSFDKLNPFTLKGESPYGIEELVFETLAVASLDEPFSQYGLLASNIEVAKDGMSVTFTLNPKAKFSDGSPVKTSDVAYSLDVLKSDTIHPYYDSYYKDIVGYELVDDQTIRFLFERPNRELPLIASQLKILPEKYHAINGFVSNSETQELKPSLGSGPYTISDIQIGKSITYRRNVNYWAEDHPVRKGMFNYDQITIKYYKDKVVALEAFKAGEFDFISVNIAKQWARDMKGKKFKSGTIFKRTFPHSNNAGMQGFLMNTRRPLFKDRLVRKAMGLALDFSWLNRSLFHDQYQRNHSYFSNSYLSAKGVPKGLELEYLEPFRGKLPDEVFTLPPAPPVAKGTREMRKNLLEAKKLLQQAGWQVKDGILVDSIGKPFKFDILLVSPSFERVMAAYVKNLKKLGMQVNYRTIDSALYVERLKKFDFDMIVMVYGQSQSPGNEQRGYWHSTFADRPGGHNYAGIKSDAVDAMVDKVIYAATKEELAAACSALDRVLWYGYYLVPNWYLPVHRLSYHDKFYSPDSLPLYYNPFQLLMTWWMKTTN
ncbi:MAG: extracellular solute-binding protein [Desulforhopalus sp.]